MLKDLLRKYYFDGNYNCAETLLRAGNEYYGLALHDRDMKLVGVYGAGIQCGNTCGAILGAAAILSMKYIETKAHESTEIQPAATLLMEKIREKLGSTLCCEIKPRFFEEGSRCIRTLEAACSVLEETIDEYEKTRKGACCHEKL